MLDRSALKSFRPLVATPCYGGMLCLNYALGVLQLQRATVESRLADRVSSTARRQPGHPRPQRLRGPLPRQPAIHPSVLYRFGHRLYAEAAFRLLLADRDVAAGVYPLKREDWPPGGVPQGTTRAGFEALYQRYTVNTGRQGESSVELVIDSDGFMQVREAPTGFMCIKRSVFDRLIAAYPELRYVPDWPKGTYPEGGVHYRFFDVMVDPESRRYLSEDYGFCRLWEKIGGEVLSTPPPISPTRASGIYTGDFASTLKTALPSAVGAPEGQRMHIKGLENLKRKT